VVVLVAVGFGIDRFASWRERSALRACVVEAESDLDDLSYRTAGLEVYIASAVDRPDVAPSVRRSLRGIVQETVLRGLPPLERDESRCEAVRAWHGAARRARADYLAYLTLRLDQLQRAVADLEALHVDVPALPPARARARVSLADVGVTLSP
jgi:hypothetical protein